MSASKPLAGIRILSVEQFAAGPYGTMFLADLGAEVIKIENPAAGGDPARYGGPFLLGEADSEYFQTWNLNKRSIELDLKSPAGRADFQRLAAEADAVVNNLRGDLPAKLGLDYPALSKVKPSIVCLHISAYGRDTSRASWPGYDYLMQAESGLMHLTGEPDSPPARFGAPSMIDHMTGMTAMVGLLSALLRARESGQGCDVDVSLLDVALHQLGYAAIWYLNEGVRSSRRPRSAHFSVGPVQTQRTRDGWIFVMCMTDKFWLELVEVLRRPDLESDPRFATPGSRGEHREALTQMLDEEFSRMPTEHWLRVLNGRLPVAPVLDVAAALDSGFVAEAGMVRHVPHPRRSDFRVLSNPLKIDGERPDLRVCSPLGADSAEVLPPRGSIEAVIHYVDPQAPIGAIHDVDREKTTLTLVPHRMRVRDARPVADRLGLERTGFVWIKRPTAVTDFGDARQVEDIYLAESAALVKELTGADKVVTFGHLQRDGALVASRHRPVFNAHIDYDEETVRAVARRVLSAEEFERRAGDRIVLANVWRPIEPVERDPLAVCDASSVEREDLVFGPIGGKSAAGVPHASGWNLSFSARHRWYYLSRMRPDEVLVFKLCDTDPTRIQWAAHTAIEDPATPSGAAPRRSIEVRTLAFIAAACADRRPPLGTGP